MTMVMAMLSGIATSSTAGNGSRSHPDRDKHRDQDDKPDQVASF